MNNNGWKRLKEMLSSPPKVKKEGSDEYVDDWTRRHFPALRQRSSSRPTMLMWVSRS